MSSRKNIAKAIYECDHLRSWSSTSTRILVWLYNNIISGFFIGICFILIWHIWWDCRAFRSLNQFWGNFFLILPMFPTSVSCFFFKHSSSSREVYQLSVVTFLWELCIEGISLSGLFQINSIHQNLCLDIYKHCWRADFFGMYTLNLHLSRNARKIQRGQQ